MESRRRREGDRNCQANSIPFRSVNFFPPPLSLSVSTVHCSHCGGGGAKGRRRIVKRFPPQKCAHVVLFPFLFRKVSLSIYPTRAGVSLLRNSLFRPPPSNFPVSTGYGGYGGPPNPALDPILRHRFPGAEEFKASPFSKLCVCVCALRRQNSGGGKPSPPPSSTPFSAAFSRAAGVPCHY